MATLAEYLERYGFFWDANGFGVLDTHTGTACTVSRFLWECQDTVLVEEHGKVRLEKLAKLWMKDPRRPQIKGFTYLPFNQTKIVDNRYNTWVEKPPLARVRSFSSVLKKYPTLCGSGFRVPQMTDSQFQRELGYLLDKGPSEVEVCAAYLAYAKPSQVCKVDSYGFKHAVEHWTDICPTGHKYVSNGSCIAACLMYGFAVKPFVLGYNLNAWFGIDRAWYDYHYALVLGRERFPRR